MGAGPLETHLSGSLGRAIKGLVVRSVPDEGRQLNLPRRAEALSGLSEQPVPRLEAREA